MTHTVHLELTVPRSLWELCGYAQQVEDALRLLGVWPSAPVQAPTRWRLDPVRGAYVVELAVAVDMEDLAP